MSEGSVARLDFATNVSEVTAQVARALQELQSNLEAAGRGGAGNIGGQVIEGLGNVIQIADDAGASIQALFTKILEGSAKLNDIKGPQTLGGMVTKIVQTLRTAEEQFRSTPGASDQLGGAIQRQIGLLEELKRQATSAKEVLGSIGAPQAGDLERFLSAPQITRATNLAAPYAIPVSPNPGPSAEEVLAAHRSQGLEKLDKAAEGAGKSVQEMKVFLDTLLRSGLGEMDARGVVRADLPNGTRIAEPYPFGLPGANPKEGIGTEQEAQAADVRRDEAAAYKAEQARLVQAEKNSLALTRQQQGVNRAFGSALTEDEQRTSLVLQQAHGNAFLAGEPGYSQIGKSNFFTTPQGPSKVTAAGLDTNLNFKELQQVLAAMAKAGNVDTAQMEKLAQATQQAQIAAAQRDQAEKAYTKLLQENPNLQDLHTRNPGYRDLGAYLQLDQVLYKRTQAGLEEVTGAQDLYKAEAALARVISSEGHIQGATARSPFDAFLGGAFGHGFDSHQAFDPKSAINNLAATAGVLARYGYEFKLIQGAISGVKKSIQDYAEVQDTLVDLDSVIKSVGADNVDLASAFTSASSDALDANTAYQIGIQTLAAYRDEIAAGTSANTVFERSVTAIGQAMVLTGQTSQAATQNIIASTTSFQLGSGGGSRILDSVVNAVHNYGGDKGQILSALSTSGAAAQQAGVSPEEMANIIALIQSRTGDNGTTVAQSFDRLVSRQDNQQFRTALSGLGIQQTGNLSQEIAQMSAAYKGLTTQEQQAFLASVGGSRNLKDLLPLFEAGGTLINSNARSMKNSGAAAQEYQKMLSNLSGQLKILGVLLTDILTNVGASGLFTGLEVGLAAVKPLLQGVNDLLTAFNQLLPGSAKTALGLAADLLLLGKSLDVLMGKFAKTSVVKTTTGVTGPKVAANNEETLSQDRLNTAKAEGLRLDDAIVAESGTRVAVEAANAEALNLEAVAQERLNLAESTGAVGRLGRLKGGFQRGRGLAPIAAEGGAVVEGAEAGGIAGSLGAGAGGLTRLLLNPVTAVLGGLAVGGGVYSAVQDFEKSTKAGSAALDDLSKAHTADQLKQAASEFGDAATATKQASSGFFGTIVNRVLGNAGGQTSNDKRLQTFASSEAKRLAVEQNADVDNLANTAFGAGSSLTSGLQAMKDQGVDTGTQLQALSIALGLVKSKADDAASSLVNLGDTKPKGPTGTEQNILALAQGATGVQGSFTRVEAFARGAVNVAATIQPDPAKATAAIRKQLKADNISADDVIPDSEVSNLADAVMKTVDFAGVPKEIQEKFRADLANTLKGGLTGLSAAQLAQQTSPLDDTALTGFLDLSEPLWQNALSAVNPKDPNGKQKALQRNVDQMHEALARSTQPNGQAYARLLAEANQAEDALAQQKVSELETIRQAAENAAGGNLTKIRSIRKDYFDQEIRAAGDDTNVIIGIFDQMTKGEINLELTVLDGVVKIKEKAVEAARAAYDALAHGAARFDPGMQDAISTARRDLNAAIAALGGATSNFSSAKNASKSPLVSPQDSITSGDSAAQAAQQTHIAYLNSLADPRNPVSQAQTALNVAQYQLSTATKKNGDYYNAVKAVNDAEYQLAQAKESRAEAINQAKVFPGSQLDQAASEIKTAKDELAGAEKGTGDWYKALGDLQKAQVDYANAVITYNHNRRLLHLDVTDPLAVAKEQLRQDRGQLDHDQANNATKDVTTSDKLKIKQDTAAKENTAFSQKMQDEQTAYDLQNISADQYLKFLDHQRSVLQSIHRRTRQQMDELNQVDQAIKGLADGMNGQFNLGDIKVPTPYEARRYAASKAAGVGYDAQSSDAATGAPMAVRTVNNHVNVTINGNDLKGMQKAFHEALNNEFGHARDRHSTRPRRI